MNTLSLFVICYLTLTSKVGEVISVWSLYRGFIIAVPKYSDTLSKNPFMRSYAYFVHSFFVKFRSKIILKSASNYLYSWVLFGTRL